MGQRDSKPETPEEHFTVLCMSNKLEEAKAHLQQNPQINTVENMDKAFEMAIKYTGINTGQWIQSMYPFRYALVIQDNHNLHYGILNHIHRQIEPHPTHYRNIVTCTSGGMITKWEFNMFKMFPNNENNENKEPTDTH